MLRAQLGAGLIAGKIGLIGISARSFNGTYFGFRPDIGNKRAIAIVEV